MKQVILIALFALAGCATTTPAVPNSAIEAPLRAAREVQDQYRSPLAQLHSRYAQEGLTVAKKLEAKGKSKEANLMRMRAQMDAELALAHARSAELTGELSGMSR